MRTVGRVAALGLITALLVAMVCAPAGAAERYKNTPYLSCTKLKIGGIEQTAAKIARLSWLDTVTAGTVTASKVCVADSAGNLGDFNNLDCTNLDAGKSGTAGTVDVFAATASRGKLSITCANQTGNTAVNLDFNAMGQATKVNVADPGAAASYVVQSTAAVTLAEADVLDAVTPGTVVASKAVVADANKDVGSFRNLTVQNLDAGCTGASPLAGSVDIYPVSSAGKITWTATANSGNYTIGITNAAHAQASAYTIPDAGAMANFVMLGAAQTTAGQLKRADLTEDALQIYGIPLYSMRQADLAGMGITETAGDHYCAIAANVVTMYGETANNNTKTDVSYVQFVLPPSYVAAGDCKVRVKHRTTGAGTAAAATADCEVYEQDGNGAVGNDLCATAAATSVKTTWTTTDFVITATTLVAGDIINVKLTTATPETATANIQSQIDGIAVLLDVKG